ncbi:MAG: DUF2085 domain-containing protein [Clostridia bacterium]|nr:DUF2085 domain-containing protein [Clostridia bacterium]
MATDTSKKDAVWAFLMRLGTRTGCHQMAERSFSFRGYQYPVCARCTGLFFGQTAGVVCGLIFHGPGLWFLITCAALFTVLLAADGLGQHFGWWVSTNPRRLITGLLCGFFVMWGVVFGLLNWVKGC